MMMSSYPYDVLGPRPGAEGGPWLATKTDPRLKTPPPMPMLRGDAIGGLLGTPVTPRVARTAAHRVRFAILTTLAMCRPAQGRAARLWPNVVVPRAESFHAQGKTHPFRDSFASVPMVLTDVPGVYEHASDDNHDETLLSPQQHRAAFPDLYVKTSSTPEHGPRYLAQQSPGMALLKLPKPVSYNMTRNTDGTMAPVTTTDRSRAARELWALERRADAILRADDFKRYSLDVISRDDKLPIVAADPAAYLGPPRMPRHAAHRYEEPTDVIHLVTPFCGYGSFNGWQRMQGLPCVPETVTLFRTVVIGHGVRYVGITSGFGRKERTGRAARILERAKAADERAMVGPVSSRGKAVTAVTAASRSLARILGRADEQTKAAAAAIASLLASSASGAMLTLTDGSSILVVDRRESTWQAGRESMCERVAGTHSEVARRAALAGLTVAD